MKTLVIGLLLALSSASKAADISATAIAAPVINLYESKTSLYTDSIQIHDVTKIRSLLKAMRICDTGAYSYGSASCDSFVQGSNLQLIYQVDSKSTSVALATIIVNPMGYQNTLQFFIPDSSGKMHDNYILQTQLSTFPINKSAGFESRGYAFSNSSTQNNMLLAIQVIEGNIQDSNVDFNLMVNGQIAGSGTFKRCSTLNCGL